MTNPVQPIYSTGVQLAREVHSALIQKQAEIVIKTGEKVTIIALANEAIMIGLKYIRIEQLDKQQTQLELEETWQNNQQYNQKWMTSKIPKSKSSNW